MNKLTRFFKTLAVLFFFNSFALLCQTAQADEIALDSMLQEAVFVFEGTVQKVEYRHSDPVGNDAGMPYTFVSYSVERIIKGAYSGAELTLRFLGGPTGKAGEILMLPNYPLFDAGDHDILFVTGNTYFECPLVGCNRGRFRFINGLIVNENGQTLMFNADGSLSTRSSIEHDDLKNHDMGGKFNIQKVQDSLPQVDEQPGRGYDRDMGDDSYLDEQAPAAESKGGHEAEDELVQADGFGDILSNRAQTLGAHAEDGGRDSVINAEIDKPFLSPANRTEAAPYAAEFAKDAEDRTSTQFLPENSGPPPSPVDVSPMNSESETHKNLSISAPTEKAHWPRGLALFLLILLVLATIIQLSRKKTAG